MKSLFFALTLLLSTGTAFTDDTVVKYQGPFTISPKVGPHKTDISGTLELLFQGNAIKAAHIKLPQAVFGKLEFLSSEQWFNSIQIPNAGTQIVAAFKLQNVPHKWYYVLVAGASIDPTKFDGAIYRADMSLSDIQEIAKNGVMSVPAGWTAKGTATVSTAATQESGQ